MSGGTTKRMSGYAALRNLCDGLHHSAQASVNYIALKGDLSPVEMSRLQGHD